MFIDTHAHLSYSFGVNPPVFISNANNAGVEKIIVSCCDKESILEGLELIEKFNNIYLTVGFHPENAGRQDNAGNVCDEDLLWLEDIVSNCSKVVGIGEIGLDYYWVKDNKDEQKDLFIKQLEIAKKFNLPLVIHSRDSIQDTYDILSKYDLKGDIHCFSGSSEMAKKFIELGYVIGIGGVVTFSNSKLYEVVKEIGLDNIVLETDSPYLSPFRGRNNESCNIPIIAEKISEVLDVSVEEVRDITTRNANRLFDLS